MCMVNNNFLNITDYFTRANNVNAKESIRNFFLLMLVKHKTMIFNQARYSINNLMNLYF